jgi:hypothetical protein
MRNQILLMLILYCTFLCTFKGSGGRDRDKGKDRQKLKKCIVFTMKINLSLLTGPQRPDHVAGDEQVRRGGLPELQRRDHRPAGRHAGEGRQDHPWQLQRELGQVLL